MLVIGLPLEQFLIEFRANFGNMVPQLRTLGATAASFFKQLKPAVVGVIAGVAALGIALIRAGRRAVAMSAVMDAAFREVASILPETSKEIDGLRDAIIDMSRSVPQLPLQLTEGLYQAISAGARDTAEALNIVEVAARTAVAGLTDTGTVVDVLTTVLNAFQLEASQTEEVADILFKTVEQGKIRFGDLAASLGNVATSAGLAGVTIAETSAAIATLTKFGLSAEASGNAINRLILTAINATEKQKEFAAELGIEFSATAIQTKGLIGFIRDLNRATGGNIELLGELIGSIRAARAGFVLAGDGLGEYSRILSETTQSGGAMNDAFVEINGSIGNQAQLLRNKVNVLLLEFGGVIVPSVIAALEALNEVLETSTEKQIRLAQGAGDADLAAALKTQRAAEIRKEALEDQIELFEQLRKEADKLGKRSFLEQLGIAAGQGISFFKPPDFQEAGRTFAPGTFRPPDTEEVLEEEAGTLRDIKALREIITAAIVDQTAAQEALNDLNADDAFARSKLTAEEVRILVQSKSRLKTANEIIEKAQLEIIAKRELLGVIEAIRRGEERERFERLQLTVSSDPAIKLLQEELRIRLKGGAAQKDLINELNKESDKREAILNLHVASINFVEARNRAEKELKVSLRDEEEIQKALNDLTERRLAAKGEERAELGRQITLLQAVQGLFTVQAAGFEVVADQGKEVTRRTEEWKAALDDAVAVLDEISTLPLEGDMAGEIEAFIVAVKKLPVAGRSADQLRGDIEAVANAFGATEDNIKQFTDALEADIDLSNIREIANVLKAVNAEGRVLAASGLQLEGLDDEALDLAKELGEVNIEIRQIQEGLERGALRGLDVDPDGDNEAKLARLILKRAELEEGIVNLKSGTDAWKDALKQVVELLEETSGFRLEDSLADDIQAFVDAAKDIPIAGRSFSEVRAEMLALGRQFGLNEKNIDQFIDALEQDIDLSDLREARSLIEDIQEEARLLGETEFKLGGLSDEAKDAALELKELNKDIRQIQQDLEKSALQGLALDPDTLLFLEKALAARKALRDEIDFRLENQPEFLLGQAAVRASDDMRKLNQDVREFFRELGADIDISPALQGLLEGIGEIETLFKRTNDAGFNLSLAIAELGVKISEAEADGEIFRAALIRLKQEGLIGLRDGLAETEGKLADQSSAFQALLPDIEGLNDVLQLIPSLDIGDILAFPPGALTVLQAFSGSLVAAKDRVTELEVALAGLTKGTSEFTDTEEDLRLAEAALARVTAAFTAELLKRGVAMNIIRDIIGDTQGEQDDLTRETKEFLDTLGTIINVGRGLLSIAQAFDAINESTERALRGIINVAEGIANIVSKKDVLGGVFQIIGGGVSLISGLAGLIGNEEDARRQQEFLDSLGDVNRALNRLRTDINVLAKVFSSFTGTQIAGFQEISDLGAREFSPEAIAAAEARGQRPGVRLLGLLELAGITFDELALAAEATGIPLNLMLDTFEAIVEGRKIQLTVEELRLLDAEIAAFFEGLRALDFAEAVKRLDFQLGLLDTEFDLFADAFDNPIAKLNAMKKAVGEFGNLSGEVGKAFGLLDFSSAEGRAQAREFIRQTFKDVQSGAIDVNELGEFTVDSFLDFLLSIFGLLEEAAEEVGDAGTTKAFQVVRTITEVTGNRMVGVLTTISIINQLILATVREILLEMGGTLPTEVAITTLRVPGTEQDILAVETQQLEVLQNILDAILGNVSGSISPPTEEEVMAIVRPQDIPFVPHPVDPNPPRVTASVTINTTGGVSAEDAREVAEAIAPEIDRLLEVERKKRARFQGFREPV